MTVLHNLDNGSIQTQYTPDFVVTAHKYTPMQKAGSTLSKVDQKMDELFYPMQGNSNSTPSFPGKGVALGASVSGATQSGPVPVCMSYSVEAYSSSENTAGFNGSLQVAPGLGTKPGEASANLF